MITTCICAVDEDVVICGSDSAPTESRNKKMSRRWLKWLKDILYVLENESFHCALVWLSLTIVRGHILVMACQKNFVPIRSRNLLPEGGELPF